MNSVRGDAVAVTAVVPAAGEDDPRKYQGAYRLSHVACDTPAKAQYAWD